MKKNEHAAGDRSTTPDVPLRGKTVLVTRPRGQSEDLAARLEALGATVVLCPTIEVVPPSSWVALDASIRGIKGYNWVIFTSANGVRFFFRRLSEIRSDGAEALAGLVVCAIGPATALALEAAGAIALVKASDSKAEGALMAIIDYLGGDDKVRGLRFLIPRARVARDFLPDGLRRLGARVDAVETYQTIRPDVEPESVLRIFKENSVDAVTFTSSSALSNFAALVGFTDLSDLLENTLVACIGPVTAETAASHGLKRVIQPELYNTDALVASIVKSIGQE